MRLPKFNIPDAPPKRITPRAYHFWLIENNLRLIKNGSRKPSSSQDDLSASYKRRFRI